MVYRTAVRVLQRGWIMKEDYRVTLNQLQNGLIFKVIPDKFKYFIN
jgi:hypothetical protein